MADIDAKKIEELRAAYSGPRGHAMRFMAIDSALYEALPALLDLAERASFPLAGDVDELCARLEEHATDWNGVQMPDAEPAKGDPTAGALRQAASLIRSLAVRVEAEKRETAGWKEACRRAKARAIALEPGHEG